ncbi:sensor histidine kinase [Streptomyces silvisoli]|uniref:histidine kinase n=1 Tax=Streptomyces silvisoli TaxID=3034235 RepID=A0ABT5ZW63_9ACTN|nr:nitrate- and nitrite sensing domain-containing protein [Streptomyces silvisoli]MDF3293273.1 nitrate- and nitrite sensing domain-containing protein [Streptomyces silvisoli]
MGKVQEKRHSDISPWEICSGIGVHLMTAARHAASRAPRSWWWDTVVEWRNWRLPVKVGAVLIVPALLAVALGVVQIQREVGRANSYAQMQRLVDLHDGLMPLIGALQMERTLSVERLHGGVPVDPAMLQQQARRVDTTRTAIATTLKQTPLLDGASANRYHDAAELLGGLHSLRQQVTSGRIPASTAMGDYSTIVKGLLDLDQALVSEFGEPQLSGPATALYDLAVAQEQIHLEHVIVLESRGRADTPKAGLNRALQQADIRLQDKLGDFRAVATTAEQLDYQRTVTGAAVSQRAQVIDALLSQGPSGQQRATVTPLVIPAGTWNQDSETTGRLVEKVEADLADRLRTTSAALQDQTSNRAGAESVLLFAALLVAVAVGFVIGRNLLRSLAVLRTSALDVADRQLPEAVASLREGQASSAAIGAVPVHTTEEFGQLARAFDAVHGQAVHLAAEQAALRSDLRNTLVNLSRRSQSLVDRLLRLMEQLERNEEDPDQLANLFKLDHLATRMRRNNENLMVLCGSTLVRPSDQFAPLDDLLRAAVSEIEHYQRVVVRPAPSVGVAGYAAGDLARLIAELLDNATAFSPPHTQVTLNSWQAPDGSVRIDIRDQGIGMSKSELAKANRRVAAGDSADAPRSRQMGLFVVGRLANRHGIAVKLAEEQEANGLRAGARVPPELVRAPQPVHDGQATPPSHSRRRGATSPDGASTARPFVEPHAPALTSRRQPATAAQLSPPFPVNGKEPERRESRQAKGQPGESTPPVDDPAMQAPRNPVTPERPHPAQSAHQEPPRSAWFAPASSGAVPAGFSSAEAGHSQVPPAAEVEATSGEGRARAKKVQSADTTEPSVLRAADERQSEDTSPPAPAALPRRLDARRTKPAADGRPAGAQQSDAQETGRHTPAGLPKRVPRARPVPDRADPRGGEEKTPTNPDAGHTHSFLSSYQAAIRRARPDET